eukprot:superscaffoldBa00006808_g21907
MIPHLILQHLDSAGTYTRIQLDFRWITDFLSDRKQQVRLGKQISDSRQGCVSSLNSCTSTHQSNKLNPLKTADGCFAFWCFPCFACKTSRELGECLCLPMLDVFGCIPPITMSMRVSVRHRYGIQGSLCNDCVCSTFCLYCVWCQMSREMKKRKLPAVLGDIIHS